MRRFALIVPWLVCSTCALSWLTGTHAAAQSRLLRTFSLERVAADLQPMLPSNSVTHIVVQGSSLWIGTGKGLARSTDGGRHWESFAAVPQFANPGIFAIALRGDTVWTSTGYSRDVDGQSVQTGSGYTFSANDGAAWTSRPQTLDNRGDSTVAYGNNTVHFLPIVVNEQNVTFDMALSGGVVWIASWSSGLRRSTDNGATWKRTVLPSKIMSSIAPTDTLTGYSIDPRQDNNYLAFSVYPQNTDTIWAGTAGGINRSVDGGVSWSKFRRETQQEPILSDWVISITGQHIGARTRIWTTNWPAEGADQQYGVSVTDDNGRTWKNYLQGIKAYDFAFRDSITYVATQEGIYRTSDGGASWAKSGSIIDQGTNDRITVNAFFAVATQGDTVYCGSSEGLVKTVDSPGQPFGHQWEILRVFRPLDTPSSSYAYPNPFSPKSEALRIHYSTGGSSAAVTIEVFDFGMNRIRTLIKDAERSGDREHDEIWNGLSDGGRSVPNGVYFYRVSVAGRDPVWAKIMVLQ
jgi:hypothetical protein